MNDDEARGLLSVEATATPGELKSAYRRMLKRWHPDRFAPDSPWFSEAVQRTQLINEAYRFLEGHRADQRVRTDVAGAEPVARWSLDALQARLGRNRLVVLLVSAVLYVGLSWLIHEVLLGF